MQQVKRACHLFLLLVLATTACTHIGCGTLPSSNLDRIVQSGVLRVGTSANMPPLNMLDKSDHPMGLDVDLARYMATALGVELRLVVKPFPDLLPALTNKEVDMVISGMTITPDRNVDVDFVGPYHITGKALLTKLESPVTTKDTSKYNSEAFAFVALEDSTSAMLVETLLPKARLVTTKNYEDAVKKVLNEEVDALVADYHACVLALLRHPDKELVSFITPFTYEPLGIAIPPGDAHLTNWVTNFLNTLRESDELIRLKAKWIEDPSWLENLK